MIGMQYAVVFALAAGATYLALFRAMTAPKVTTAVSALAWSALSVSPTVTTQAGTSGSIAVQGLEIILALLSYLAFIGTVLDKYPIDDMGSDDT